MRKKKANLKTGRVFSVFAERVERVQLFRTMSEGEEKEPYNDAVL